MNVKIYMFMIKKKKVLICGCGNIAGKYNQNSKTSMSLTHAHAIKNSKHFNIEACIDINKKKYVVNSFCN